MITILSVLMVLAIAFWFWTLDNEIDKLKMKIKLINETLNFHRNNIELLGTLNSEKSQLIIHFRDDLNDHLYRHCGLKKEEK